MAACKGFGGIDGRHPGAIAISKDDVDVASVGLARRIQGGRR